MMELLFKDEHCSILYDLPQVMELLRNAHMFQFGQLCSLLGMSGGKMREVLEAVMGCGVLVQGCWVVASHVIFPNEADAAKRNAWDYIVS